MSAKLKTLVVTLDGSVQPLSDTAIRTVAASIYSETGNAEVRAGDASVSLDTGSEVGHPIQASGTLDLSLTIDVGDDRFIMLNEVYVIGTSGNRIQVLYYE